MNINCDSQVVNTTQKAFNRIQKGTIRRGEVYCWLAVITDYSWVDSEVLELKTRPTELKRIRYRGFYTRISKIYSSAKGEEKG